jgi:transposase
MSQATYVGLDVHMKFTVAVWKAAYGEERYAVVETSPEGFSKLARLVGSGPVWAAYEASGVGWETHDLLVAIGWKVSVVPPTHLPHTSRTRKTKTDLRDARMILGVLMAHGELGTELATVWIPDMETREDRELVRRRLGLAEYVAQLKPQIRALLTMQQIKKPESIKTVWSVKYIAWLKGVAASEKVPASVRAALGSQLRQLKFLAEELEILENQIEELSRKERYARRVERMRQQKGVGLLTSMGMLVELGDPLRFSNRRKLSSYLGLVPSMHDSADVERRGHISRMGPARIRKLLNQAAWAAVKFDPRWKECFEQLGGRRGKKRAIVAIMRKLAIELWHSACAA